MKAANRVSKIEFILRFLDLKVKVFGGRSMAHAPALSLGLIRIWILILIRNCNDEMKLNKCSVIDRLSVLMSRPDRIQNGEKLYLMASKP